MTDLHSLLARIESATGPDRELDASIHWTFFVPEAERQERSESWRQVQFTAHWHSPGVDWRLPYTASLDAAIALCEHELPGWRLVIAHHAFNGWPVRK